MEISRAGIERIHGGWGVGEKNDEGDRVTYFAMAVFFTDLREENKPSCDLGPTRVEEDKAVK